MTPTEFTELFDRISSLYRPLGPAQQTRWREAFAKDSGPLVLRAMQEYDNTVEYERRPTIGNLRAIMDTLRSSDKQFQESASKPPEAVAASTAEQSWWAMVMDEIHAWHRCGLRKSQPTEIDPGSFDIEQWAAHGKHPTWSPIVDWLMEGLAGVWHKGTQARADWYRHAYEYLHAERVKKSPVQVTTDPLHISAAVGV
jgi:hypothetical protein